MENETIYLENGEVYKERKEIEALPVLGKGVPSVAYKLDKDNVIKLLHYFLDYDYCDLEALSEIKKLGLKNFLEIREILLRKNFEGVNFYVGNIAKFYESENIDLWEMPPSWLVANYNRLLESFKILGKRKILAIDCTPENTIVSKNGITIIDPDLYVKRSYESTESNIMALNDLFRELLSESYSKFRENVTTEEQDDVRSLLDELFLTTDSNTRIAKKLLKYNKTIDFVNRRIKR